jgi:NADPH:quinone reductase-like Zn-dependent oxidoreductase
MLSVVVPAFGGLEQLTLVESPTPDPAPGQVRVRLTSVGMNHAELMARRGDYKIASGDPPFTPGLEGGGVIDALGDGVTSRFLGQRVVLALDATRPTRIGKGGMGGAYRSHYLCNADLTVPAPAPGGAIPDEQLGAIWLPFLTAWGALVHLHKIQPGTVVALPAASSSVALAAAQIVKQHGGTTIGLTTSPAKIDALGKLDAAAFDHLICTHNPDRSMRPWHRDLRDITNQSPRRGVDVFFDPVANGPYLDTEIKCLADGGAIYLYGLLQAPGVVDLSPLIRKRATLRGYVNGELVTAGPEVLHRGYREVLEGLSSGQLKLHVAATFPLKDVQRAQAEMEKGSHIGKLILIP